MKFSTRQARLSQMTRGLKLALARLATPQLTSLLVRTLGKSKDSWITEMALDLLLALCDHHTQIHSALHAGSNPEGADDLRSCLLCPSEQESRGPRHVELQRHLTSVSVDLQELLHALKSAPLSEGVFQKSRKLLLRATVDGERWAAFCMATHPRLGAHSPASRIPTDLLPRVLDFL
eukprot:c17878_g1_i2.p1 GENE.c17878_g1_i2~~c17878_g1_i2.p1  ORF type:complete len:177 (-),score=23.99 c17878_g1_i2:70-600(-)